MENQKSAFAKKEEELLKFWEEKNIFEKSFAKPAPRGNFVFFEGPPTANGRPGIHHILARAFKDIILRYRTMVGYRIERKAGWDTHGLPVELQVEKELKISGKPEIEKYGIEEFNQKCKESVWRYKDEWEKLTRRIAFWLDLKNPYVTYTNDYIESLWWILKEIDKNGLLYKGYKVVPQCPRCGTSLSSHEVAQGYKNIEETSIYIKFKVKGQDNTYILSWTTTPWTLPGNVALAVNPRLNYVKVKKGGEYYILAEKRAAIVFGAEAEVVEEKIGVQLVGLEYEPLFPCAIDPQGKKAWFVNEADFVTIGEGTGVVHTAVMYGEDDFNFGLKYNLPFQHTVDESGKFMPSVAKWAGKFVKNKEVERGIIEDLSNRGLFLKEELYTHDYPFCWRCDTPLLYYAKDSWFIKTTSVRKEMVANNKKINWVPEHIKKGRFGEWLENVKDWAVSRQRYWGTPIPIWTCGQCKRYEVLGSFEELKEKTNALPKNRKGDLDVHRPFIDELTYGCSCGNVMRRVPDVFDCWFDSGAMPFAQNHYPFENKELVDCGRDSLISHANDGVARNLIQDERKDGKQKDCQFPADYIAEAIDQTRGWFYTLLAIATLLGRGAPYKNVICLGHIRDKEGKKMSKSKGNVVDPWLIMDRYGVDALRMHLFSINQPGDSKNFDEKDVQEILRKVVMLFNNVASFYHLYSNTPASKKPAANNILDKWLAAKMNLLIKELTDDLNDYHIFEASRRLIVFIDELSTWYLRRSRNRFKGVDDETDKNDAIKTLGWAILNLSKLLAPFAPFIAESVYLNLGTSEESVHLADWPEFEEKLIDKKILAEMAQARKVAEMGLAMRAEACIKVRQPLSKLKMVGIKLTPELVGIIAEELNVKNIETQDFALAQLNEDWISKEDNGVTVALNIALTLELKKEGLLREIIRTINQMRKENNLTIKDRVAVRYQTEDEMLLKVLSDFGEEIKKSVLAERLEKGDGEEMEIEKRKIKIGLEKI